jgi:hypothetical protein
VRMLALDREVLLHHGSVRGGCGVAHWRIVRLGSI